jgi:hypothetical protein
MKGPKVWRYSFIAMTAFMVLIVFLADTGRPQFWNFVQAVPHGDKLGHFFLFGGLAFLACMTWPRARWRWGTFSMPVPVLIVLVFAVGEEISQGWIPGRTLDMVDLAAGCLGIFSATWIASRLSRRAGENPAASCPVRPAG